MYSFAQKILMKCDPEWSHDVSISYLHNTQHNFLKFTYAQKVKAAPVTCMGLDFENHLGLAAGLDKNAECIDAFAHMGFGFIEVGTTTPRPQSGNEKPRLFRLPEHKAIINRMGFNNKGVDYLVEQVKASDYKGILGINIGKNKDTPEENALDDYLICMRKVYEHASYITINISSPNTPGLRNLQFGESLKHLLNGLKKEQGILQKATGKYVPLAVKIAPDNDEIALQSIASALIETGMDGVIATNTTLDRTAVKGHQYEKEAGGLSGQVLCAKSLEVTHVLASALAGKIPIIGVGGISNSDDAKARLAAGASLLQVYSGFIYNGPALIKDIINA